MTNLFTSPPTWFRITLDLLALIPLCTILATIAVRKSLRTWPWLATLCACEATKRIGELYKLYEYAHLPLGMNEHAWHLAVYPRYFWSYWIAEGIASLAALGLLTDLHRSIPLARFIPKRIALTLIAFATIAGAACVAIALQAEPNSAFWLTDALCRFWLCSALVSLTFSLVFLYGTAALGFRWQTTPLLIATAFLAETLLHGTAAFVRIARLDALQQVNLADDCVAVLLFCAWAWALNRPTVSLAPLLPTPEVDHLQQLLAARAKASAT